MLKIVQSSDNKKLRCRHSPPGPGGRRCKLCPGGIYGCYGRDARINFIEGSFDWKLKVVIHFLRVKSDWRAASLPPHSIYFFPRGTSYRRGRRINFKGGSFDWKSRVLVPFLRVKSDQRATGPPSPFSPNTSDKKFEVAILLKIVQRSYNKNSFTYGHFVKNSSKVR